MKMEVLVVEDSVDSQELVTLLLKDICHLTVVGSVEGALKAVRNKKFDLFLMDVMLEDGDGFTLTKKLRELPASQNTPVIFMTSKGALQDKAKGFELGAEDYIVKPFDPAEFQLRVESRLKKIKAQNSSQELVRGNLRLEVPLQKAYLNNEKSPLDLTPIQFKILFSLISREPEILSREQLTQIIWGDNVQVGRSLDTHITALRKKLGSTGASIQSVYGQGYRFSTAPTSSK